MLTRLIVISMTLAAIFGTISTAFADENQSDLPCLALAAYHEARGEADQGIVAVFFTIENRVNSSRFPDDVCSVVFQKLQFSWVDEKKLSPTDENQWNRALALAELYQLGFFEDKRHNALHYYAHKKIKPPRWASSANSSFRLGGHTFLVGVR